MLHWTLCDSHALPYVAIHSTILEQGRVDDVSYPLCIYTLSLLLIFACLTKFSDLLQRALIFVFIAESLLIFSTSPIIYILIQILTSLEVLHELASAGVCPCLAL